MDGICSLLIKTSWKKCIAKKSQLTCCSCFKVEAVSSPLATARNLAAREAPLAGAGGRCPLETILIESFLLLSSDWFCTKLKKNSNAWCCCSNDKREDMTLRKTLCTFLRKPCVWSQRGQQTSVVYHSFLFLTRHVWEWIPYWWRSTAEIHVRRWLVLN